MSTSAQNTLADSCVDVAAQEAVAPVAVTPVAVMPSAITKETVTPGDVAKEAIPEEAVVDDVPDLTDAVAACSIAAGSGLSRNQRQHKKHVDAKAKKQKQRPAAVAVETARPASEVNLNGSSKPEHGDVAVHVLELTPEIPDTPEAQTRVLYMIPRGVTKYGIPAVAIEIRFVARATAHTAEKLFADDYPFCIRFCLAGLDEFEVQMHGALAKSLGYISLKTIFIAVARVVANSELARTARDRAAKSKSGDAGTTTTTTTTESESTKKKPLTPAECFERYGKVVPIYRFACVKVCHPVCYRRYIVAADVYNETDNKARAVVKAFYGSTLLSDAVAQLAIATDADDVKNGVRAEQSGEKGADSKQTNNDDAYPKPAYFDEVVAQADSDLVDMQWPETASEAIRAARAQAIEEEVIGHHTVDGHMVIVSEKIPVFPEEGSTAVRALFSMLGGDAPCTFRFPEQIPVTVTPSKTTSAVTTTTTTTTTCTAPNDFDDDVKAK